MYNLNSARPISRRDWLRIAGGAAAGLGMMATSLAPAWADAQKPRIVSIGGALTETIYALGAQAGLVGVDSTSVYPVAASQLPNVGYARALSAEGILALAPSLILASEDAGPPAVLQQLRAARVPLTVLAAHHQFEGMLARTTQLGALLGKVAAARQLNNEITQAWQRVRAAILARQEPPLRVLFVLSHTTTQIMVGGAGSSAEAMLTYAGAHNAAQGFQGFKPLTPEAVIASAPDVLLFTSQGLQAIGGVNGALQLPGVLRTPAGQNRRIVALEAMFMLGFGPRLPQALAALDAALHSRTT